MQRPTKYKETLRSHFRLFSIKKKRSQNDETVVSKSDRNSLFNKTASMRSTSVNKDSSTSALKAALFAMFKRT